MPKQDMPFAAVAFVCTHKRPDGHPKPCCADRGGAALRQKLREMAAERGLEGQVAIFASGCLGACQAGPAALSFPDGTYSLDVKEQDLPALLDDLTEK